MKTKLLIEQHFHGCFGIDFNRATVEQILHLSKEIVIFGIGGIYPTIVTDTIDNERNAIAAIKEAASRQTPDMAKILGIHFEGIFLNPAKKGVHNATHFRRLTPDNYKLIEDDFIKIITLAPELDEGLLDYLSGTDIKIQAGHCVGGNLYHCSGVTHIFNAMAGIVHRGASTALSALISDDIYTEIIADGIHVSDQALKLLFKAKPIDKIILVSDCIPITKSDLKEMVFADENIYYDGMKATSQNGKLAGSTTLLPYIVKRLHEINMFNSQFINNPYNYHNIDLKGGIEWDDEWNIIDIVLN